MYLLVQLSIRLSIDCRNPDSNQDWFSQKLLGGRIESRYRMVTNSGTAVFDLVLRVPGKNFRKRAWRRPGAAFVALCRKAIEAFNSPFLPAASRSGTIGSGAEQRPYCGRFDEARRAIRRLRRVCKESPRAREKRELASEEIASAGHCPRWREELGECRGRSYSSSPNCLLLKRRGRKRRGWPLCFAARQNCRPKWKLLFRKAKVLCGDGKISWIRKKKNTTFREINKRRGGGDTEEVLSKFD